MTVDLGAAEKFVATHGRVLEWRRLRGEAGPVLAALDAYRNADGGYGWGLEPDLRSVTSQPVGAMHALEVMAEVGDTGARPLELLGWLETHTLDDGGVPFALPFADTDGSAPHWAEAAPGESSLQMTAQLAAQAHRLARSRTDVAEHPWLAAATGYCLTAIAELDAAPHAYELMFAMLFLDAAAPADPRAGEQLTRLAGFVRTDGPTPVAGGAEGEVLHPLDFTPVPGSASRALFDAGAVAADMERLAGQQQSDGGWAVSFPTYSPAAALEWRGYATVQALAVLRS